MAKFFNTAGPCISGEHYMVPSATRCVDLHPLVREKRFFVIHAPRQTGKTTLIQDFMDQLNESGDYLALYCSLETAQGLADPAKGIPVILRTIEKSIRFSAYAQRPMELVDVQEPATALHSTLATWCSKIDKPLVILFDEVDCLEGDTLLSFLRQLRQGYVERKRVPFVHALALVGMRNIRDYKVMMDEDRAALGTASPFNIVSRALTIRNFNQDEVRSLLAQHTEETGQIFPETVGQKIYEYTGGQPWLCNAIAYEVVAGLLEGDVTRDISEDLIIRAVENIILRRDTHIDSLLERLKEARVRRIVEPVLLGRQVNLAFSSDDAAYVFDLGLLVKNKGDVMPANPIYREVIIRALTHETQYQLPTSLEGRFKSGDSLDMTALLKNFQQFWRENSDIWIEKYEYREAAPHLILQAFLQRVVNGGGHIDREYSAGRERVDLCVSSGPFRYPLELKIRYRPGTRQQGLEQLAGYMDCLGLVEGWLILFERDPEMPWEQKITWEEIVFQDKKIHVVGC